jgi:hypothetical protein
MSEKTLRKVLKRLDTDRKFRKSLYDQRDWASIINKLDLSPAELAAISTQDEDALRRLAGGEVKIAGQNLGFDQSDLYLAVLLPSFHHAYRYSPERERLRDRTARHRLLRD